MAYSARLGAQQKQQQKAQQLQGLGLITAETDPLSKGTGFSPLDDMNTAQIGEIKARATQMVMSGADPASTYMYLQSATNGMKARQQDAIKALTTAQSLAKATVDKDPAQDYNGIYQQYLDNIFYTKDDKGQKAFNPNFNPSLDFTQNVQPVYDEVKLKQLAAAEIPKLFPERETPSVPSASNPLIKISAKAPAYHTVDPKSGRTVWNTRAITLKDERGNSENVEVIADDGVVSALYNAPNAGRWLQRQEAKVRAAMPKTVSDDDVKRIVATGYLQQTGLQPGAGVKEDDKEFVRDRQARKDQEDSYYKARQLSLSEAAGARSAESLRLRKDGKLVQGYVSPYDVTTGWATGQVRPNDGTQAGEMVSIHTRTVNGLPVVDLNGIAEKELFKDPDNGQMAKVFGFQNPKTRKPAYQVVYYRKATPAELQEGKEPFLPTSETKTIEGSDFNRYHTALAPQLQLDTKKKNYNATLNSTSALTEE